MNPVFTKIRDKHALWYKGIVFAACVLVCAYLLPKHTILTSYKSKVGEIWLYDDVVATSDFLLKKTAKDLDSEKEAHNDKFSYFKKTEVNTIELLSKADLTPDEKLNAKIYLDNLYETGVYLSLSLPTSADSMINMVTDNEVYQVSKNSFFNRERASLFLSKYLKEEHVVNEILDLLVPNIIYDPVLSNEVNNQSEAASYIYKAKIEKGTVLIRKNDLVTEEKNNLLLSYTTELSILENSKPMLAIVLGQLLVCFLVLGIIMLFLAFFRKAIFSQNMHVTFIFLIIVLFILISSVTYKYDPRYIYGVPFCLVPILIRVFFDSRTSLFTFLNIVLICAFFTSDKFEFVFVQLIAGIGNIFSVADMGKRSKLFVSSVLTFLFYVAAFVAFHLVNNTESALSNLQNYIPFLISSACVLFAFPLIYLFENLFGFISDFTLLELCDLNSPLLRQLSQKVPGTFQHSLQVANLAEEACYKIGGNALLVRTGAMYHDIGKMENPRFFTENQVGEVSPHEDLSPEESARIIISHVIKGVEMAKEYKLPETVIDFIRTHHGTTTTRYFLHHYKKEHVGEVINEDLFRYPGPIPFSKETAILMMADGVEASSRSLKKYDAVTIDELVDKIINYQINENQFINADITFRDINQIKKIFKKRLMNIYHVRIEYPR
jgi:putative nucleotidyltransferase with HDIG domain